MINDDTQNDKHSKNISFADVWKISKITGEFFYSFVTKISSTSDNFVKDAL